MPRPFKLHAASSYLEYAGEKAKKTVLKSIRENTQSNQQIFLGLINVLDPRIETVVQVRDTLLEAADVIPATKLGSCDDCGFSPIGEDTSTWREIAFAKIRARIEGTSLAEKNLAD
jgi:5-methyltetrahydropteroyltriglutamate--homocysteine methyltransferase